MPRHLQHTQPARSDCNMQVSHKRGWHVRGCCMCIQAALYCLVQSFSTHAPGARVTSAVHLCPSFHFSFGPLSAFHAPISGPEPVTRMF